MLVGSGRECLSAGESLGDCQNAADFSVITIDHPGVAQARNRPLLESGKIRRTELYCLLPEGERKTTPAKANRSPLELVGTL